MRNLPLAGVCRIIKEAGAIRVSEEASIELQNTLQKIGDTISKKAIRYTSHAGRKTVNADDIELATKDVLNQLY